MKAFADSLPPIEQPNYFKVGFFNKKKAEQANGILRAKYEQEVEERAKEIALAKKKSEKAFDEYERACKLREAALDKLRNLEINKLNEKIERLIAMIIRFKGQEKKLRSWKRFMRKRSE